MPWFTLISKYMITTNGDLHRFILTKQELKRLKHLIVLCPHPMYRKGVYMLTDPTRKHFGNIW
jgi:hypothetical protein